MMGLNSSLWFDSQSRATGKLRNTYFRIRPINLPQRIADFAYSGVSANSIDDEWHGVRGRDTPIRLSPRLLGSGSLQRVETALHFVSGTAFSKKYDPPSGSTVWVTSDSYAIICCVRSAMRAASSVGSAKASS